MYDYNHHQPYYYLQQHGAGLPVFRGGTIQRGYGLGGLFRGLLWTAAPVLKKGLINIGERAMKTGIESLSDVSNGSDFKSALKKRARQNINEMVGVALQNKKRKGQVNSISQRQPTKGRTSLKKSNSRKRQRLGIL